MSKLNKVDAVYLGCNFFRLLNISNFKQPEIVETQLHDAKLAVGDFCYAGKDVKFYKSYEIKSPVIAHYKRVNGELCEVRK